MKARLYGKVWKRRGSWFSTYGKKGRTKVDIRRIIRAREKTETDRMEHCD